jgi:hypothetical protein
VNNLRPVALQDELRLEEPDTLAAEDMSFVQATWPHQTVLSEPI